MRSPIIVVNFKNYYSSVGKNAVKLAKGLDAIAKVSKKSIAACVSPFDIHMVSSVVDIPVLSEHIDSEDYGAHTGKLLLKSLSDNGACGSLINHSEDRETMQEIERAVDALKANDLTSIVCAKTPEEAKEIAKLRPDYIAIEPPELIGGNVSVTTADPKIVADTLWLVHEVDNNIKVLCGAGVKNSADVRKAIELGCDGVLLASGITKADDPIDTMTEMLSAFD